MAEKVKILVCGARFGQFYMEAIKKNEKYELAGILARGSDLAKACARRYETELYTDFEEASKNIDVVCIAVKTGVLGGNGTELAIRFLEKGIAVILEQPVHYQDLTKCYRIARKYKTAFHVGNLYLNLPQVKRFLSLSDKLMRRQQLAYINVDMATQVSYPFIRIMTELLGKTNQLTTAVLEQGNGIFQTMRLTWNGVEIQVRAQNQEGNSVSDNCMHVLFQITLGTQTGNLLLTDACGTLMWRNRMEIPSISFVPGDLENCGTEAMRNEPVKVISKDKGSYGEILENVWTKAVDADIEKLLEMKKESKLMAKEGALELSASQNWTVFTQALGYPVKIEETVVPESSFEDILSEYRTNASMMERYELLTIEETKEAVTELNKASLWSIVNYFQEEGIFLEDDKKVTEQEIINRIEIDHKFDFVIDRWLQILEKNHLISRKDLYYNAISGIILKLEIANQWGKALRLWKERLGTQAVGEYFYSSAMALKEQLQGKVKANYLLYPQGDRKIADDLYRNTMIAWYMNRKIASEVAKQFKIAGKLKILEVGAGTGATSDVVIEEIKARGLEEGLEEYCYTDLSPYFLVQASDRYNQAKWLVTRELDINKALDEQGIAEQSYDIIIAAGVINNVDDTVFTLMNLAKCLKQDGKIYVSEAIGESIQMLISQVFMMQKATDERGGVNQTFMSREMWEKAFAGANLKLEKMMPDEGHKLQALEQSVFVLRRDGV